MPTPVGIVTDVGNACDSFESAWVYKTKELLPHRGEIGEMLRLSEVFLGNLKFCHLWSLVDVVEDRSVWLTWLEVEWTVFGLQDDIVTELAIQIFELAYGLLYSVFSLMVGTIYERTPHHDATKWFQGIGEHIGSFGMGAMVVARSWLSLRVRLDQETSEVRDGCIDFLGFLLPPLLYLFIERVGSLGITQCHWRGEVDGEIDSDAVWSEDIGDDFHLIYIFSSHHLWRGIHIVEYATIDAQ